MWEIQALIAVWGETGIQEELDGAVRNKVVFKEVAEKLHEMGYKRDWEQCCTKIRNLKKQYRAVKDHNNQTGNGRKACKYFEELDKILGHRPASVPTVLLDSGTISSVQDSQDPEAERETNGKIPVCAITTPNSHLYIILHRRR